MENFINDILYWQIERLWKKKKKKVKFVESKCFQWLYNSKVFKVVKLRKLLTSKLIKLSNIHWWYLNFKALVSAFKLLLILYNIQNFYMGKFVRYITTTKSATFHWNYPKIHIQINFPSNQNHSFALIWYILTLGSKCSSFIWKIELI
jgi:hypothetical protein